MSLAALLASFPRHATHLRALIIAQTHHIIWEQDLEEILQYLLSCGVGARLHSVEHLAFKMGFFPCLLTAFYAII